jgi:hypothetical protein
MIKLPTGRFFWGLLLLALGVIWLLNSFGVTTLDFGTLLSHWWPAIPIYFAAAALVEVAARGAAPGRGVLWGSLILNVLLIAIFTGVLGNLNGWWSFTVHWVWQLVLPLLLLAMGISLLLGHRAAPGAKTRVAIMGGGHELHTTWDDVAAIAIMGGTGIDFSGAGLPDRDVLIDIYALMGGVDVFLPPGVRVVCEWTGIMGGVDLFGKSVGTLLDRQRLSAGEGPVVRVRAHTVMGGVKIRVRMPVAPVQQAG